MSKQPNKGLTEHCKAMHKMLWETTAASFADLDLQGTSWDLAAFDSWFPPRKRHPWFLRPLIRLRSWWSPSPPK